MFVRFLEIFNFKCIYSDKCVFVAIIDGLIVHDGLVLNVSQSVVDKVLLYLKSAFKITEGDANELNQNEFNQNSENQSAGFY